jgi:hypothetical protein
MGARLVCLLFLAITISVAGCGGSTRDDGLPPDVSKVLGHIGKLRRGETLIQGEQARVYGPFTFKRPGYLFRFRQYDPANPRRDFRHGARLVVSLQSRPRSGTRQLLVRTNQPRGQARVRLSGALYVNVSSAESSYILRFTPGA